MANPQNLRPKPWPKGVSGNPAGRPPTKAIEQAFQEFLYEFAKSKDGQERQRLEVIMARMFADAAGGNTKAQIAMLDRAFGKPVQPNKNEHSGPNGGPIESINRVELIAVKPDGDK